MSGGNTISERFGDFLMEHGPSTMNASAPKALEISQALDLATSAVDLGTNVRRRYLLDAGKLCGISVHPFGFFPSRYLSPTERCSHKGKTLYTIGFASAASGRWGK